MARDLAARSATPAIGRIDCSPGIGRRLVALMAAAAAALLVGCAHPINVEPDLARLPSSGPSLPLKVGYHVPPDLLNLEVTTPGGGGDSVRYRPYAAMLAGYQRLLGQVFQSAVSVGASPGQGGPAAGPEFVLTPNIVTNSGGSNFFTWPPESFTVDLSTSIRDRSGKVVANPRVVGVGAAITSERIVDHGFSGRRAFEDALRKMDSALRDWANSRDQAATPSPGVRGDAAERLRQLKDLRDRNLISESEYELKRKAIVADL